MFCGSATWRRWKSAPAGNSSVSVSSPRCVGRASVRRLATGIERSRTASRMLRSHASVTCSSSTGGASARLSGRGVGIAPIGVRGRRGSLSDGRVSDARCARLEQLDAVRERLAREVGVRSRHLHERELERKPRVGALSRVLDRDGEEVDQPQDGRLGELVRLLAEELLRLLGDRQRVGDVAHVLHEQQMAEVLEEVGDEPAEILSLLRELLDEEQRAGRVPVDDHVAEPEQRLLVDRADELQAPTARRSSSTSTPRAGRASRRRRGTSRARRARSARAPSPAPGSPRRRRRGGAA